MPLPSCRALLRDVAATLGIAFAAAGPCTVAAQSAPVPVQISVSLGDNFDPLHGIPDQRITIHGEPGDSTIVVTDARGVASVRLAPGQYRFVTSPPYRWHARDWQWDVRVTVRPGMPLVDLMQGNAIATVARSGDPNGPFPIENDDEPNAGRAVVVLPQKDPAAGRLFSLLIPGGGQIYAGRHDKGYGLLAVSLGSIGVAYALWNQQCHRRDPCNAGPAAAESGVALFAWIYSIATAPADVRRWNREHAGIARVAPTLQLQGRAPGLGLRLRW